MDSKMQVTADSVFIIKNISEKYNPIGKGRSAYGNHDKRDTEHHNNRRDAAQCDKHGGIDAGGRGQRFF